MRRIESSSTYLLNIYEDLSTKVVEEINKDIKTSCENLKTYSINRNNSTYSQSILNDNGTEAKISPEFPEKR